MTKRINDKENKWQRQWMMNRKNDKDNEWWREKRMTKMMNDEKKE